MGFDLFHLLLSMPFPISKAIVETVRMCPSTATKGDQLPGLERAKPRFVLVHLVLPTGSDTRIRAQG